MRRTLMALLFAILAGLCAAWGLHAQTAPAAPSSATSSLATPSPLDDRLARLEQKAADAQSAGDNAWMLVCSALVLMMTGPGLALFYGGLVRRKNILATMMHSFALMALITVLWAVVGFSLCFHSGNQFIGGLGNLFLHD